MIMHTKKVMYMGQPHIAMFIPRQLGESKPTYAAIPLHEWDNLEIHHPKFILRTVPKYCAISRALATEIFRNYPHLPGSTPYDDDWANENYRSPL